MNILALLVIPATRMTMALAAMVLRLVAFAKYMAVARTNTKNKLVTLFGRNFCAMGGLC
jgi:hypothetical protein